MRTITLDLPDELADQLAQMRDRLPELLSLSLQQPAAPAHLYRAILTFLASAPTIEQIAAFSPPPEMQRRLESLLDRAHTDTLIPVEQAELDEFERIEHLVVMIKAGALPTLIAAS